MVREPPPSFLDARLVWLGSVLLFGLIVQLTWAGWFHSAIAYLRFNLLEDKSLMYGVAQWMQNGRLSSAIRESDWLFPLIEGSHILAIPLSVGMVVIFDLRLLGLAFRRGPAPRIFNEFLRWSRIGFVAMFITGGLLFITQAEKAWGNPFFRTKMILLLLLGINAAVYQTIFYPKMAQWDLAGGTPAGARFCAGLSLVLWVSVIICGRTMAYQL